MATREDLYLQGFLKDKERRLSQKSEASRQREKTVRRRDWVADYEDEDTSLPDYEMRSERRTARQKRQDVEQAATPDPESCQGTVVEVSSGVCRVSIDDRILLCGYRGALRDEVDGQLNLVAVGDEVIVSAQDAGNGTVESILPRRSALSRPEVHSGHLQQVIVANVDQLLIVAAWREPAFWPELADRYLIAAERYALSPIICVNKVDLAEDGADPNEALRPYDDAGYRVIMTSIVTGAGIDELRAALVGRTTALAGLSGVGKSSLLSAAFPGLDLKISAVNDRKHEGRHTTTQSSLHRIGRDGFVVDTPGIREFGLSRMEQRDLAGYYPELAPVAAQCQYADCLHVHEPGCAVRQAVREGKISRLRYTNYRKILATLAE